MKKTGFTCVKSVLTILLTSALIYLTICYPDVYQDTFKSCVTMVVTFYFSHQLTKRGEENDKTGN